MNSTDPTPRGQATVTARPIYNLRACADRRRMVAPETAGRAL